MQEKNNNNNNNNALLEFEDSVNRQEIKDEHGNHLIIHDPYDYMLIHNANQKKDSFFRCLSFGLYHNYKKYSKLRQRLLLHFINIVFHHKEKVESVNQFLLSDAKKLTINEKLCLKHVAIIAWCYKQHLCHPIAVPNDVNSYIAKKRFISDALDFIEYHNTDGRLSCKFTFAYLFADVFKVRIKFYQFHQKDELDFGSMQMTGWITPPISNNRNPPVQSIMTSRSINTPIDDFRPTKETSYSLIMIHAHKHFKLLLPCVKKNNQSISKEIRERLIRNGMKTTEKLPAITSKYVLRVYDDTNKTNNVLNAFKNPCVKQGIVYVCNVKPKSLVEDRIYQIYPGGISRTKFDFSREESMFVYIVERKSKGAKLISSLPRDDSYPYFFLPSNTKQVLVIVAQNDGIAETAIKRELKIKIIKE